MKRMPLLTRNVRVLACVAAGVLAAFTTATAAQKTWVGTADGSWLNGNNWSPSALSATGDSVLYDATSTANLTQTLDANWSLSTLTVGAVGAPLSIAGGGAYALSCSGKLDLSQATADVTISADFAGAGTAPAVVVGANRTLTLSNFGTLNGVRGPGVLRLVGTGKGVLDITAGLTVVLDGGTLSNNPPFRLAAAAGETATVIVTNNSTVKLWGNGLRIGLGTAGTGMNLFKMEGGNVFVGPGNATSQNGIYVGSTAGCSAQFDLNGGLVVLTNRVTSGTAETSLRVPSNAGAVSAVVNLNGGRLIVPQIDAAGGAYENGTLNFNGTTVAANRNHSAWLSGVPHACVLAGGAIIDTVNFNLTIAQALEAPGTGSGGGLTKLGSGILTLAGANTYTGSTLVSAGTLALSGSLNNNAAFSLADGATLVLATPNLAYTPAASVGSLSLGSAGAVAVTFDYSGYAGNPATAALDCAGAVSAGAGPVTLTITNLSPGVGAIPLIHYGSTAPSLANFKLNLPFGVRGNLALNSSTHTLELQVTQIIVNRTWYGSTSPNWDTTTPNWDGGTTQYQEANGVGNQVTFDDTLCTSPLNNHVNLTGAWKPAMVNVHNNYYDYSFSGSGKLSGAMPLNKDGAAALTIATANDFAGGTALTNGTLRLGNNQALGTGPVSVWGGTLASDSATARVLSNAFAVNTDFALGDGVQSGALTLAGPVDFNNAMRTLTVNTPVTLTGGITNGGLYKTGPETLLFLNCTNSWGNTSSDIRNGTVILSNTVLITGNSFRTACTQDYGLARLLIGPGSLYLHTGANGNFRIGASGGNATATNQVDVAGEVSIPNPGTSDGRVLFSTGYNGILNLLAGGLLTTRTVAREGGSAYIEFNFDGGTLRSSTNPALVFMQNLSAAYVRAGGAVIDSANKSITIAQALLDGGGNGGLTKLGTGALTLTGANTYTGPTLVSAGTLWVNANHAASGPVTVASGATLGFLSDTPGTTVAIASASVSGKLSVAFSGQTDVPTTPAAHVTTLALAGTVAVNVTQLPAAYTGETVPLIQYESFSGTVATGTLPAGIHARVVNNPATKTIELVPALIPPEPTTLNCVLSGNQLTLSWPPDYLGCILQAQTNAAGLSTNWVDVVGSDSAVSKTLTIDPAQPAVFFRLKQP